VRAAVPAAVSTTLASPVPTPFRVAGPGSNLPDHTLLQVAAGGELIIAGSTGNGYRLAELMGATNPSGWSGALKGKIPAGVLHPAVLEPIEPDQFPGLNLRLPVSAASPACARRDGARIASPAVLTMRASEA
jgi:hypothetical protein